MNTADVLDRDDLAVQHIWLVNRIARKYKRRAPDQVDLDDLVGAGMVGLVQASRSYQPAAGTFRTYAGWRIKGAILDWMRDSYFMTGTSRGCEAGFSIKPEDVTDLDRSLHPSSNPWGEVEAGVDVQCLVSNSALDGRERQILAWHYVSDVDLNVVAGRLDVHPSFVSHLHRRAVSKLRNTAVPREKSADGWRGVRQTILDLLAASDAPMLAKDLVREVVSIGGCADVSVRAALVALKKSGRIVTVGRALYTLPPTQGAHGH